MSGFPQGHGMTDINQSKDQLLEELANLRNSEETWRSLVENAPIFILVVNREGIIEFLNHTHPGYSIEESIGKPIFNFIESEYHGLVRDSLEKVFTTGDTVSYEMLAAGPSNSKAWYETNVGPIKNGEDIVSLSLISTDITTRKEAETSLQRARETLEQQVEERTADVVNANDQLRWEIGLRRQSEERYRLLVETTNDLIWELDRNGMYTYVSPRVKETLGHEPEEMLGKTPFEFMPPDEARRIRDLLDNYIASGRGSFRHEIVRLHKDGHRLVHETSVSPVFDNAGTCCGFRGVSRDVTDRKEAERSLQQHHQELQAIYDGMVDGLLIADIETKRFVRANRAICQMLGYTEEEVLSLSVMDIHPPDDLPDVLDVFKAQAEGRVAVAENLPVLRKDGSVFYADITTNHLDYQGRHCNIGFFRDITDRKKAEENLRQSEETARALINAVTESEFLVEPDGTIVTLNETAASRLGKTVEELVGECGFDFVPSDVAEFRKACFSEVLRSGQSVQLEDEREGMVFQSCFYPVFDLGGRVVRLAIYAQDITKRKAAEEAAKEEREHLRRSLDASDRERQLIVYDIHDGLTQYLSAAIMQFQTYSQLQSNGSEKAPKAFDAGVTLLGQALDEARRVIGGVRPPILDEKGVVAAVDHLVNSVRGKDGLEIKLDVDVEFDRLAPSHENAVFRIVHESVANAYRHSDSNKAQIALIQRGRTLHIEVQDWGIGFDVDNTGEGGFGLDGIRERARLLGGQAEIDTKLGAGTRIVVDLPIELEDLDS